MQNKVIIEINAIASKKLDELFVLQGEREELRQNMANPSKLDENAFDISEKERELKVLEEVKNFAEVVGSTDTKTAFDSVLDNYDAAIKARESRKVDASEHKLNFNSLKIVSEEVKPSSDDNNDGGSGSAPMDISSSDDSGD